MNLVDRIPMDPQAWASVVALLSTISLAVLAGALGVLLGLVGGSLARRTVARLTLPLGATRSQLLARMTVIAAWSGAAVVTLWAIGAVTGTDFDWLFATFAGAAGIVGIAAGFASQTSAANVISGLFLVGERPFEEGDVIRVEDVTGVVIAVDLLSVKLRTFDNTFVRVPNETVMKATIVNMSRFPIRRMDVSVWVPPQTPLPAIEALVEEVSAADPRVLVEPAPNVIFQEIGERGVKLLLIAWTTRETWVETRARWSLALVARLEEAGIDVLGRTRWEREDPGSSVADSGMAGRVTAAIEEAP